MSGLAIPGSGQIRMQARKLTIVIPVRNCQNEVAETIRELSEQLAEVRCGENPVTWEIIVVDDGSADQTAIHVRQYAELNPAVRLICHHRPRGFEAAGQSGLDRSVGEFAFIVENAGQIEVEDVETLLRLCHSDETMFAARIQRRAVPVAAPLSRRINLCGFDSSDLSCESLPMRAAIQVIRRSGLHALAARNVPPPKMTTHVRHYSEQKRSSN